MLICTHWDARPFADQDDSAVGKPILAADDGASGSAVLLEIARQLQQKNPEIGVDLVFLDVEDYGRPPNMTSTKSKATSIASVHSTGVKIRMCRITGRRTASCWIWLEQGVPLLPTREYRCNMRRHS